MKLAGVLALILAAILAIWAIADYSHNEQDRQRAVEWMARSVTGSGAVFDSAQEDANKAEKGEQFDGVIGIVAAAALIGGIAMLSRGKKEAVTA